MAPETKKQTAHVGNGYVALHQWLIWTQLVASLHSQDCVSCYLDKPSLMASVLQTLLLHWATSHLHPRLKHDQSVKTWISHKSLTSSTEARPKYYNMYQFGWKRAIICWGMAGFFFFPLFFFFFEGGGGWVAWYQVIQINSGNKCHLYRIQFYRRVQLKMFCMMISTDYWNPSKLIWNIVRNEVANCHCNWVLHNLHKVLTDKISCMLNHLFIGSPYMHTNAKKEARTKLFWW